ncbi:MAG: hypothetical protein ACRC17_06285 [Culicoidibacterales bacterium]
MKKKLYIQGINIKNENHAGSKAKQDIIDIATKQKYDFAEIGKGKNKIYKVADIIKSSFLARNDEIKIYQYPIIGMKYDRIIGRNLLLFNKRNNVLIIHDIISLIFPENISIKEEIGIFNSFDYIISHNKKMTEWLKMNGVKSQIVELEMFDYLVNNQVTEVKEHKYSNKIAIPGNLTKYKSGYVYELINKKNTKIKINLYGPNFEEGYYSNSNVCYKGIVNPDDIVNEIDADFGLVWDGPDMNECRGISGNYTKYNNPHKTSLYIAAGLPLIVWENAAISEFILKYNIGIVIKSLEELETIIPNISDETYRIYQENLKDLQKKVTTGYFFTDALNKIEDMINNESH